MPAHLHRTLGHMIEEFLHGILHFDTRAWRTLPLLAWKPGKAFDRSILFVMLDMATGISHEAVVSVTAGTITSLTRVNSDTHPYGQPPYLFEEYEL